MKMMSTIAACSVIVAGCTMVETGDEVWYKEGATVRDREAALSAARSQALQATQGKPDPGDQTKKRIVVEYMSGQGWRLMPKDAGNKMKPETSRNLPPPRLP
jgi:hypothetical protein